MNNNTNDNLHDSGIPKRRALGRGLEELLNSEVIDYNVVEEKIVNETPKEEITQVKLDELRPNPYQPRKVFDEKALQELADSIKEHGVFQPIIVKKSIKGYEIIAGERRVKASRMAGLTEIPAIIKDFNDTQMMEIALLENLQREDLTAIEEANAYKKLIETLSLTQEELGKRLGKSRSHITNMLGLLNLPKVIQDDISSGDISMGHARVLSKLETLTKEENIVKHNPQKRKEKNTEYLYLQRELSEKLGTKVTIKKNKIEIYFVNDNDLNRLLDYMNIEVGK